MESLGELVATFAERSGVNAISMHHLLRRDSAAFLTDAAAVLSQGNSSAGCDHLLTLLSGNNLAVSLILDPALLTDDEAVALATRILRVDPVFDVRLMRSAALANKDSAQSDFCPSARRALRIISALGDCRRSAPLLMPLLRHPDPWVRSRAAILLGAATHNCVWAEQQLHTDDARVRANIVESLWGATSDEAKQLFRIAARDGNNRVIGNALLGLYRSGAVESVGLIAAMGASRDPRFRATAVWVMGRTEDARFGALLRPMLDDPAPGVRPNAIRALGALRRAAECTEWLRVTAECATAEENRFTLRLRVTDGAAVPVTSLPGTAFVCWNGDELLTAYDVSVDTLRPGHYLLEASDAVPRVQAFRRACSAAPQRGAH